ncbi:winged helix-turn-helix transcriptional regulator [Saccharothrix coeruleofusca]|uniref:Transcriptional regulator n=1 Tax=Saccharothrix coeruleofusca TaxID=33919 RepID=A0A918EE79_9PSEU|nr:helix-turn-helix domain-containing protein [Saccharothrix coeruleofusca]MBP2338152.1 DNA-binding HxlR family transcriptional regulator [Saccharothrix coeruleofusca]GGP50426.1 transcriptional regulator [Saccharothrix coeruleofusca]
MAPVRVADQQCTIALPAALLGERWTLLLVRQAFLGTRRFEDFQSSMAISRSVLAERLGTLVEEGILRRVAYKDVRTRYEYRLTEKGLDLYPVLMALRKWGDRWMPPEQGPSFELHHRDCGGGVDVHVTCAACREELTARDVRVTFSAPADEPTAPGSAAPPAGR